jgi:hypothetical protein
MRFIFFLLLFHFIYSTALSQSLSGHITKLEKEIADAKSNNADPAKIKELEKILEQMKFTQSYLDKAVIPKPKTSVSSFPGASWSGFLSSTREGTSQVPVSTRSTQIYLFFSDAIPTLHRNFNENDELNFTDDKGSGSVKDHSVITIGTQTSTCDCSGGGTSELHEVAINKLDSTYSIDAIAPICTGGNSDDGSCGMTWSITISNQKFTNPNILSGTQTVTAEISGMKGTVTNTWYLMKTIDVELIVKPSDYDTWLPEPGIDEKTVGKKTMRVDLLLQGKNGKPLTHKAKKFEIRLENTSREPGITINYPVEPISPAEPDLKLLEQGNADVDDDGQKMDIVCDGCTTANFNIGSFDGGGYSTLKVIATLDDESFVTGHLITSTGTTEITIPKRNGSLIGEAWLKKNNNPGDYDDKDSSNGNNFKGDGITAYEEYRGVISMSKFNRLDPKKKEVGVVATKTDFDLFGTGIGWFESASDLKVIRFDHDKDETWWDGRLNRNAKTSHDFDQYAIYLANGGLGRKGTLGITYGKGNLWIPANVTGVIIDRDYIMGIAYKKRLNEAMPGTPKFTLQEYLAQTVAHELGHAVNIDHHGDNIKYDHYDAVQKQYVPYTVNDLTNAIRIFNRQGNLITTRPYVLFGVGASSLTVEGGDISCMLNYYPYYNWGYSLGADNAHIYNQEPLLPLGRIFCTSEKGTGINATKLFFGIAAKGDCKGQIQLRN